jgi:hypothetical protein
LDESIIALPPRNYAIFNGTRISIAHLRTAGFSDGGETLLIPYSLQTISGFDCDRASKFKYLIFGFGSELQSI